MCQGLINLSGELIGGELHFDLNNQLLLPAKEQENVCLRPRWDESSSTKNRDIFAGRKKEKKKNIYPNSQKCSMCARPAVGSVNL